MAQITAEIDRLAIHDKMTGAQETRYHELRAEYNDLDRAQRLDELRDAIASGRVRLEPGAPTGELHDPILDGGSTRGIESGTARSAALRAIDARRDASDDARHRVATMLDRAQGTELDMAARWAQTTIRPAYERAVGKLFRDPANGHREFDGEELAAFREAKALQRAMALSPDSAGGFLVPFTLDPNVNITNVGSVNPLRRLARIETTATESWSGVTSAGVTAAWYAEAAEVADHSPTFGQPQIAAHRASSFIAASIEVTMDAGLAQQLGALFVDAKDQLEATAMTTGTGTGQPKGIITGVSAVAGSVVTSAATALTVADIYAVQNALPPRWRPRAEWMANLSVVNMARQLAAGSGLNYSVVSDATTPPRMLGWALNENSVMDGTITATANDYLLLAGDFRQFAVVDRVGAVVEYLPLLVGANRRPTGERGWFMYWRTGADVLIADAFRLLNLSA